MKHAGLALFIEPQGSLRETLGERKRWLEKNMPGQAYCSHPPHCTLLFSSYDPATAWLEKLRTTVATLPNFEMETTAWLEFPNDALAGGGHTVAYRSPLSSSLATLQMTVAHVLAPFRPLGQPPHPLAQIEPFAGSLQKYGFPFVGTHWIPHFTIGSPKVAAHSPLLVQLMSGPATHRFSVRSISLWRVDDDHHERLHELALADNPTHR